MEKNSKQRFSDRVGHYVLYRPGYPAEAVDWISHQLGLGEGSAVADIGAGTGIFTRLLLERKNVVYAVEPNANMRGAAIEALQVFPGFQAVDGSAEQTGLPDRSMDGIVCAQAFHWFNRQEAKIEFRRVLKPQGKAALIWNSRKTQGSPFLEAYEALLRRYGTDYASVNHKNVTPEMLEDFFQDGRYEKAVFTNGQLFDFEQLQGRLLSSSYCPQPGHPDYEPIMIDLRELFDRCNGNGTVSFDYETEVFWGEV